MVEDVACRGDRRTAQMYSIAAISIAEPSLCLAASSHGSNPSVVWQAFYGWRQRVEVAWRAAMAAQTTMMPRQAALLQVRAEAVREAFDTWREASQRQPHGVPSKPHGVYHVQPMECAKYNPWSDKYISCRAKYTPCSAKYTPWSVPSTPHEVYQVHPMECAKYIPRRAKYTSWSVPSTPHAVPSTFHVVPGESNHGRCAEVVIIR